MRFEKLYRPFYQAGQWAAHRFAAPDRAWYKKMERELIFVSGQGSGHAMQDYMAKKFAAILIVLSLGFGGCICVGLAMGYGDRQIKTVKRPSYGQGDTSTGLNVQIEGEEGYEGLEISVQDRKYTKKETARFLKHAEKTLKKIVLAENKSWMEVRSALYFPNSLENGAVKVQWYTDNYELLDDTGKIVKEPPKDGIFVEVTAILECQGQKRESIFEVKLFPQILTEHDAWMKKVEEAVRQADKEMAFSDELELPRQVDGRTLRWEKEKNPASGILIFLVLLSAVCISQNTDEKIRRRAREKRVGLGMDFPIFLYRLTALLRAGLTIRSAFRKIADNYEQDRQVPGARKRFVYEEVIHCCNEMQSGVAEAQAYENFGKRCQLPQYIKTGSILAQNLKKGSDGLADLLEAEALRGMEERRGLARKMGEQAGTRLLFPMMLMLMVVMVILMVPAILSFSF